MSTPDAQPAARRAALFDNCLREAAHAGGSLMEMMTGKLRLALQQQVRSAPSNERDSPAQSLRLLDKHEARLRDAYPGALQAAFAEEVSGQQVKSRLVSVSFDELELMNETQVDESVEVARALQVVLLASDHQLTDLNALICAAQGLRTVQAHRNPVRPELYVRTLRKLLAQTDVPPRIWLNWMQHMGATLGGELGAVYASLSDSLRSRGVTHAAYTVTSSPDLVRPAAAGRDAAGLTLGQLHRLLAGELDAQPVPDSFAARFAREFESGGKESPPPAFANTVPAAFEALQEMKQVDQVMQRLAKRASDPAPAAALAAQAALPLREQLRRQARGLGQALGLEVVALMVDNITRDTRLLAPVRQAMRDIEPALLRLALIDPRFFSHKQHPARRLIEQMTHRSLAYRAADAPEFEAFLRPLRQAVDALSQGSMDSAEPFELALKSLEPVWDRQEEREREQQKRAAQVLARAEQRNEVARSVAKEMRAWPEAAQAPAPVVTFLYGPWAQVVAQARLAQPPGAADPAGCLGVARDLLWSTQPGLQKADVARLTGMIAPLLGKLREGLARIEYPAAAADLFFNQLMALHQQALKPAANASAAPDAKALTRARLDAMFRDGDEARLWLAPSEAQQSGFIEATDSLLSRPRLDPTQPLAGAPDASQDAAAAPIASTGACPIPLGAWVELQVHGRWTRMQLTWASGRGNLFMFTGVNGSTHSMTRHSLDQLVQDGALRLFSDQAVLDSALDAVAQAAMRNSVDVTL
ncbi:MAG: DUF1631 family protein [Burkholderiaceae bacterium]|nr:MAG: DUF1631 family protein [Burkholderiaceae bacterium]